MAKAKRTALSNRIRFEVFKRDSFKCQYCGTSAPEVVLNVDHIIPVAEGGGNEILNLVTSCFKCNSGKSDKKLSDNSAVTMQKKQLDELNERREQLSMIIEWKGLLEDKSYEIEMFVDYFNKKNKSHISLTELGIKNFTKIIKQYTSEQIIQAINDAYDKYFGEIEIDEMWNKIPRMLNFIAASENDKNKMKFWGAIKARFSDTSGYSQWNTIHLNKLIRTIYEEIDSNNGNIDYSYLFKILNSNTTYRGFSEDIEELYNQLFN